MSNTQKLSIFLVDDDILYLKLLEVQFLENADFEIATFTTGEDCIKNLYREPDLIILDFHLDGIDKLAMNGIQVLDQIKNIAPTIPVVILSCQDKIEVAVECMHHKAFDYVVKSETAFMRLKHIINNICKLKHIESQLVWYMDRM